MPVLEPLGQLLLQRGLLDQASLKRAQEGVQSEAAFLTRLLDGAGISEPDLVSVLAEHLGMPGVDLSRTAIDLAALDLVPRAVAEDDLILPLSTEGGRLHVAVSAASHDTSALDEVHFITGMEVSPYAAAPGPLEEAIAAAYDLRERGQELWHGSGVQPGAPAAFAAILPEAALDSAEVIEGELLEEELTLGLEDDLSIELDLGSNAGAGKDDEEEVVGSSLQVRVGPQRILVVDDEPEIVKLLKTVLSAAGYRVETASDGREAEEKLTGPLPDLVLLDAMLPHVHGFEICSRIKSSARSRALPVIMMSAIYRGWRFAQDARESYGADDYIEKPFHLPDLLYRVKQRLAEGGAPQPDQAEASKHYQAGLALLQSGKTTEARAALELALKDDPFSARVQFALGKALQAQGDVFRAITAYEKAVELRPLLFPALRALAGLYLDKGFRRKAAETLERALQAAPDPATRETIKTQLLRLL